jgi:hypothetical protein
MLDQALEIIFKAQICFTNDEKKMKITRKSCLQRANIASPIIPLISYCIEDCSYVVVNQTSPQHTVTSRQIN